MTAYLYRTRLRHVRTQPRREFEYLGYLLLVDLDDLPQLPRMLRPLARIEARDHVGHPGRPIRDNIDELLARHDVDLAGGRILMLSSARVLGHVFNPLTLFWCHNADGSMACVVAEVHNTYGQRHAYVLAPDELGRASTAKTFYVSPFLPLHGQYRMRLRPPGERLAVSVALQAGPATLLTASLRGVRVPASTGNLVRLAVRFPLAPLAVSARIRVQGIRLWRNGVPIQPRPDDHQP